MISNRTIWLIILLTLSILGIAVTWPALYPFVIALILAYILDGIIKPLHRYTKLSRKLLIVIIFILFFGIAFSLGYIVIDQIIKVFPQLKKAGFVFANIDAFKTEIADLTKGILPRQAIDYLVDKSVVLLRSFLAQLLNGFISFLQNLPLIIFIIPFVTFYFLWDKEKAFALIKKYTRDELEDAIRKIFVDINKGLGGFIKAQFLLMLIAFALSYIVFAIAKTDLPLLLAAFNGIMYIVPLVGAIIGGIPPVVSVIIKYGFGWEFWLVLMFLVVLKIIADLVITPKLMSATANIHPVTTIISIFVGGYLLGIIGMFLAVPIAISLKIILLYILDTYIKEI